MKKRYIFLVLVVALVSVLIIKKQSTHAPVVGDEVSTEQEARTLCYIWNTEAGDSASLSMTFTGEGGSEVSGFFNWRPAEKDSKVGTFTGIAGVLDKQSMSRTATLWWEASAEGMTTTEELQVIFGDGSAGVGFGEMRDRGDGVYVYADKSALSYEPTLMQTDCDDPAMK